MKPPMKRSLLLLVVAAAVVASKTPGAWSLEQALEAPPVAAQFGAQPGSQHGQQEHGARPLAQRQPRRLGCSGKFYIDCNDGYCATSISCCYSYCPEVSSPTKYPTSYTATAQCNAGCPSSYPGDGYCDSSCNNYACNYDNGDCTTPTRSPTRRPPTRNPTRYPVTSPTKYPTNYVPPPTKHPTRQPTKHRISSSSSSSCPSSCPSSWRGDGGCDSSCNSAVCNYDDGDCASSTGYRYQDTSAFYARLEFQIFAGACGFCILLLLGPLRICQSTKVSAGTAITPASLTAVVPSASATSQAQGRRRSSGLKVAAMNMARRVSRGMFSEETVPTGSFDTVPDNTFPLIKSNFKSGWRAKVWIAFWGTIATACQFMIICDPITRLATEGDSDILGFFAGFFVPDFRIRGYLPFPAWPFITWLIWAVLGFMLDKIADFGGVFVVVVVKIVSAPPQFATEAIVGAIGIIYSGPTGSAKNYSVKLEQNNQGEKFKDAEGDDKSEKYFELPAACIEFVCEAKMGSETKAIEQARAASGSGGAVVPVVSGVLVAQPAASSSSNAIDAQVPGIRCMMKMKFVDIQSKFKEVHERQLEGVKDIGWVLNHVAELKMAEIPGGAIDDMMSLFVAGLCNAEMLKFTFGCLGGSPQLLQMVADIGAEDIKWPDVEAVRGSDIHKVCKTLIDSGDTSCDDLPHIVAYLEQKDLLTTLRAYVDIANLTARVCVMEDVFPSTECGFLDPLLACSMHQVDNFTSSCFVQVCKVLMLVMVSSGHGTMDDLDSGSANTSPRRMSNVVPPTGVDRRSSNAFNSFDTDGDGRIDANELAAGLSMMGNQTTEEQAGNMIAAAGGEGGSLSKEEFTAVMSGGFKKEETKNLPTMSAEAMATATATATKSASTVAKRRATLQTVQSNTVNAQTKEDARKLFNKHDANHDGTLDGGELRVLFKQVGFQDDEIELIAPNFAHVGDGLNFDNFLALYVRLKEKIVRKLMERVMESGVGTEIGELRREHARAVQDLDARLDMQREAHRKDLEQRLASRKFGKKKAKNAVAPT